MMSCGHDKLDGNLMSGIGRELITLQLPIIVPSHRKRIGLYYTDFQQIHIIIDRYNVQWQCVMLLCEVELGIDIQAERRPRRWG